MLSQLLINDLNFFIRPSPRSYTWRGFRVRVTTLKIDLHVVITVIVVVITVMVVNFITCLNEKAVCAVSAKQV